MRATRALGLCAVLSLIGIGLAFLASQLLKFHKILNLPKSVSPSFVSAAITIAIILALLSPIYKERLDYLAQNTNLINQANEIFQKDYPDFAKTVDYLKANRPGRIWVGRPGNWGNDFNVGHTHAFMQFGSRLYALSLSTDIYTHSFSKSNHAGNRY